MTVILNPSDLLHSLRAIKIPHCEDVQLELRSGRLTLMTRNFSIEVIRTVAHGLGEGEGTLQVNYSLLHKVVSKMQGDTPLLCTISLSKLVLQRGKHTTTLPVSSDVTWGQPDDLVVQSKREFPMEMFQQGLEQVVPACAAEYSKEILQGVHLHHVEERLALVATDGHRLVAMQTDQEPISPAVTVVPEMLRVITSDTLSETVELFAYSDRVTLLTPRMRVIGMLLDGTYPAYERVIPSAFSLELSVDRHDLNDALLRVLPSAQTILTNTVKLEIKDKRTLRLSSSSYLASAEEELEVKAEGKEFPFIVGVNGEYLAQLLKYLNGILTLKFSGHTSPMIIESEDETLTHLLMPLRLPD